MTVFEHGAMLTRGGQIEWVGDESALPEVRAPAEVRDLGGAWVTPGLIDCHTHLVFAGTRPTEYAERLQGRTLRGNRTQRRRDSLHHACRACGFGAAVVR